MASGNPKMGCMPTCAKRTAVAAVQAKATGIMERGRNSKSNNSIASNTAATGLPKVAAMPPAAPAANNVLRSIAVVRTICPTIDPSAAPVAMMGPSAPKGPPVPMAIAADKGLRNVSRACMRLSLATTPSMASGMPCPRIPLSP